MASRIPFPYRVVRRAGRMAIGAFYDLRRWRDPESGPLVGPMIIVANHPNAGLDPVLVATSFERPLRFLAKATLFKAPGLGGVLRAVGALPAHRQVDGQGTAANASMFDAAEEALAAGEILCIFPEGTSHDDPQLRELRTGAARIALAAVARGADVRIVPAGLFYAERERFRSEASVWIGRGLAVSGWLEARGAGPAEGAADASTVRALTGDIARLLDSVTFTAPSARLLGLARDLAVTRPIPSGQRPDALTWWAGRVTDADADPDGRQALTALIAHIEHCNEAGFTPEDLAGGHRFDPSAVARDAVLASLRLPVAVFGAACYAPAFQSVHAVTVVGGKRGVGAASVKVVAGAVLYPIWALVLGRLLGRRIGRAAAASVVTAGWFAHLWSRPIFAAEGRRWHRHLISWRLRRSPALQAKLEAARDELDELVTLVAGDPRP